MTTSNSKGRIPKRLREYVRKDFWFGFNLLEGAVLVFNLVEAAKDPEIGHGDVSESLEYVIKKMEHEVHSRTKRVEKMLWACNMLDEKGKFYHPQGLTFDQFVAKLLDNKWRFDKEFSMLYRVKRRGRRPKDGSG